MPYSPKNFASTYGMTLTRFVASGEERQLEEAYALGRAAFANGATILELVAIHREAAFTLFGEAGSPGELDATFAFLAEALSTFEMAQRGYWEAQEAIRRERAIAMMLQRDLMPTAPPKVAGLDVAVRYLPGETGTHAGGDWYDVFELDDGRVGFVVGDITGHGVGAAAAMGQMRIAVLAYALDGSEPAVVIEAVDVLLHRLGAGDICTLAYVLLDLADEQLVMSSAGHPPPLLLDAEGSASLWTEGRGRLVGVSPPTPLRSQSAIPFPPGSRLVLYTDGLVEELERAGDDGFARLREVADGFAGTADELCDHLLAKLAPNGGRDDICVLVLTRQPT